MDRFEKTLAGDPDIVRWSSYVGRGAVRFYLPLDERLANDFFGQLVIVTKDFDARQRVAARLRRSCARSSWASTASSIRSTSGRRSAGRSSTG